VADSPLCGCGVDDQTANHLLLSCASFSSLREQVWPLGQPSDIKVLTMDPAHARKAARFMFETGLLGQFREADIAVRPLGHRV
jgi:hypothetical protein